MKNWINYFYSINAEEIHHYNNKFEFKPGGDNYILRLCESGLEELNEMYEMSLFLRNNMIYCHKIILNNEKKIITYINEKPYVLMKCAKNLKEKVTFDSIIKYSFKVNYFNKSKSCNWKKLWIEKIDYFEYQVNQFGLKYQNIRNSFGYFAGVAENGIQMLNAVNQKDLFVSHKRINSDSTLFDLYDPFNIILYTRVRDTAEIFKNSMLIKKVEIAEEKENIVDFIFEIKKCFDKSNLDNEELKLFLIRFMFPSFYFDTYEQIIKGNFKEDNLLEIIKSINYYQNNLCFIYKLINNYTKLPVIEWIEKSESF